LYSFFDSFIRLNRLNILNFGRGARDNDGVQKI